MASKKGLRLSRRAFLAHGGRTAAAMSVTFSVGASYILDRRVLKVPIVGLPARLDGFKVAFAADFHLGKWFPRRKVAEGVRAVASLGADLILLGGDYVTESPDDFDASFAEIGRLSAPHGVYAVAGNHDNWGGLDRFEKAVARTDITPLVNSGAAVAGGGLWIAGLGDLWGCGANWDEATAGAPPGAPIIALCHNPYTAGELPAGAAALILAGHTHGWQVYIPLVTRAFIPENMSKYRCGFYRTAAGTMYVTTGVGLSLSRMRFLCRPEVVLFELTPAVAAGAETA